MFWNRWKTNDQHCETQSDPCAAQRARTKRTLTRRRERFGRLVALVRQETSRHAAEKARQNELIASLKASLAARPHFDLSASRQAEVLESDLETALSMLDDFEAEACRTRNALEQVADLEAQASAQAQIIADLEDELAAWRGAARHAA